MPTLRILVLIPALCLAASAAEPIDGRSANRWQPQAHWSPKHEAKAYALRNRAGWLELTLEGTDSQMTWTLAPSPQELKDEPRYLVFTYRAVDLRCQGSSYLLHFRAGAGDWENLFVGADLIVDSQEHVLAADLLSYALPAPITQLALRIGPPVEARGQLWCKIQLTNEPPSGVKLRRARPVEPQCVRIEAEDVDWKPSPHWTPRPPQEHQIQKTEQGARFLITGPQCSMRWSARAPAGIDLGKMPFVSMRYRGRGEFGPWGYAFYMGVKDQQGKKTSTYAMEPGDVDGDGRWHVHHGKLSTAGVGESMAVGIDALSPQAEIEVDYVQYSSVPPATPIDEILAYEERSTPWPAGQQGLTTLPLPASVRPPNHFMIPRMNLGKWFDRPHVTVDGIPFQVPTNPAGMLASGTVGQDDLVAELPATTREVLILLAAAFPRAEPFGTDWRRPAPLRTLDEPERLTVELIYADGSSDHMLPVHAAKRAYGVDHDIAAYAVHPSPGKTPTRFVLHDNMRNAAFGIVALTANSGAPRITVQQQQAVWYPPIRKAPPAEATITFCTDAGLTWDRLESAMLGGKVQVHGQPVFTLQLAGSEIPSSDWKVEQVDRQGKSLQTRLGYARDDVDLHALFTCTPEGEAGIKLSLLVENTGNKPVTGTLFFPQLHRLCLGSAEDTWYFCGRRGGVINRVPCAWRDEIGEAHPLQVDGFFNPKLGAGVCFMPRDLAEVFRWYRFSKDETGGGYALEHLPQTVAPGASWSSVPIVVTVVPGDWKDQFAEYRKWV